MTWWYGGRLKVVLSSKEQGLENYVQKLTDTQMFTIVLFMLLRAVSMLHVGTCVLGTL